MRLPITMSLFAVGLGLALITAANAETIQKIIGEGEGRDVYCTRKSSVIGSIAYCGSAGSSKKAWDEAAGEAYKDAKTSCEAKGGRMQTNRPVYRGGAGCSLREETEGNTSKLLIYCKVRLPFNCYNIEKPQARPDSSGGDESASERFQRLRGTGLGRDSISEAGDTEASAAR